MERVISLNLRLPAPVHEQITASAKSEDRSLNSEIVHALREYVKQEQRNAVHDHT